MDERHGALLDSLGGLCRPRTRVRSGDDAWPGAIHRGLRFGRDACILSLAAGEDCVAPQRIVFAVGIADPGRFTARPGVQYLARRVPGYSVVRRLETRTPPGAKVFTFDHLPEYHFHGELLHPIMSTEAREIAEELLKVVEQDLRPTRKYEFRWPKRDLSGIRIELKNAYDNIWRIAEIRFLSGENAVAADEWEAHANTYPWTVERVIDSDIHSIWRSWRNRTPGDWLELRRETRSPSMEWS